MEGVDAQWTKIGYKTKESFCKHFAQCKRYTPGIEERTIGCIFEDNTKATWEEVHSRIFDIVKEMQKEKEEEEDKPQNYISNARMRALDKVVFGWRK